MNDSRDVQDAESIRSGNSHVTSRPVSFPPQHSLRALKERHLYSQQFASIACLSEHIHALHRHHTLGQHPRLRRQQVTVRNCCNFSAHPCFRSKFGYLAEQASPTLSGGQQQNDPCRNMKWSRFPTTPSRVARVKQRPALRANPCRIF